MTALHVFDLDGTLLRGTTASLQLAAHLGVRDALVEVEEEFAAGRIDTPGFARRSAALWSALLPAAVAEVFADGPWLTGIREVMSDIAERAERAIVITMSPDFYARHLVEFGVHEVFASRFPPLPVDLAPDPGGILSPEDKPRIVEEVRTRERIGADRCLAYGDSGSDIPLFRSLGRTVAVNATPALQELAAVRWRGTDLCEAYRHARRSLLEETHVRPHP